MNEDLGKPEDFQPPPNFALMAAVFEAGIVVVAVCLGWLLDKDPLVTFPRTLHHAGWGIVWGIAATLPPLGLLWVCLKCPLRSFVELVGVVDRMLVPLFRHCRLMELAAISVLAGLGEEMLFRGIVQRSVADWVGGPLATWIALVAAAVLFGLAHRITTTYAVLAGLIGLYLGGIWMATGNLLVPIVAHSVYDLVALVYLIRIRRPSTNSREPAAEP